MKQHTEREGQVIASGLEELTKRLKFGYRWKNILYRRFGLFKKFGDDVQVYYHEKYPLIKEKLR